MKIVISDYPDVLGRDLEKEYACLHEVLPEAEIVTHPYTDAEAFFREMQDADCLTGNRGHAFKIVNNVAIS